MPLPYAPNVNMFIQYQNAPKFLDLLQRLTVYLNIPIKQFYEHFFDLRTADDQGLENWGKILNQSRTIPVPDFTSVFGFDNGTPPSPLSTGYPQNYNNGSFYGGQTAQQLLTNDQYRILLQFRYLSYTINNSVAACMRVVDNYIKHQYPLHPEYMCSIIEGNMEFIYSFSFQLQPFEIVLFKYNNALPSPAGIKYSITWTSL